MNLLLWLTVCVGAVICAALGAWFVIARHFLVELTRPGVTLSADGPFWREWGFPQGEAEPPPTLQRSVQFAAPGGPLLQGDFWAQPSPAPTVILSHGFHVPRIHLRSVAALEYRFGCNVLLFDYRGHGDSALVPTSGGNAEVADLTAAIDLVMQQPETIAGKIFIHGFSMGAAVALLLPTRDEIGGIIADSAYARLDVVLHQMIAQHLEQLTQRWHRPWRMIHTVFPLLAHLILIGGRSLFRWRFHQALIARPVVSIQRLQARLNHLSSVNTIPLLLIHARHDPFVGLEHAHQIAAAAERSKVRVNTYFVDSAIHCGAFGYNPNHYMKLLRHFIGLSV